MDTQRSFSRLINHLAAVAFDEVQEFSMQYSQREQYGPYEDLSFRVQEAVVSNGVEWLKEHHDEMYS